MEYDSPMACGRCGAQWGIVEGNTLICKCGYRHTIPLKPSYEELERRLQLAENKLAEYDKK